MAESEQARRALVAAAQDREPGLAGRRQPVPEISVSGLGRPDCVVSIGPRTLRLSPRHSEIMIILAACPAGLTGDELAYLLYPDDLISSTLRAELVRLRALLGQPGARLPPVPAHLRGHLGLVGGIGAAGSG